MTRPRYGELHEHKFIKEVGDYEVWIAKVQYPDQPIRYGSVVFMLGGLCASEAPFNTTEEAIAWGTNKAIEMTQKLRDALRRNQEELKLLEEGDRTPAESLRQSLQEAQEGKRLPLSNMWDGIEEGDR